MYAIVGPTEPTARYLQHKIYKLHHAFRFWSQVDLFFTCSRYKDQSCLVVLQCMCVYMCSDVHNQGPVSLLAHDRKYRASEIVFHALLAGVIHGILSKIFKGQGWPAGLKAGYTIDVCGKSREWLTMNIVSISLPSDL